MEVKQMKTKVKNYFECAKRKMDAVSVKAKISMDSAAAVLTDKSGGNHTTDIIVGMVVSVLAGLLIFETGTGYFSDTFFPNLQAKLDALFS
jgi:hypothetical protein